MGLNKPVQSGFGQTVWLIRCCENVLETCDGDKKASTDWRGCRLSGV